MSAAVQQAFRPWLESHSLLALPPVLVPSVEVLPLGCPQVADFPPVLGEVTPSVGQRRVLILNGREPMTIVRNGRTSGGRALLLVALATLGGACAPAATQPPPCVPAATRPRPDSSLGAFLRDSRRSTFEPRNRELVIKELAAFERLYETTAADHPDRSSLLRRMAEEYCELAASTLRRQQSGRLDGAEVADLVKSARARSIQHFLTIKEQYRNYPKLDELLYYLAYTYEQAGDYASARTHYQQVIARNAQPRFVTSSDLALGEMLFIEAASDPAKWPFAAAAYREALKYPGPENHVMPYAHYKLAFAYLSSGDTTKGIQEFDLAIEFADTNPDHPSAIAIANGARQAKSQACVQN